MKPVHKNTVKAAIKHNGGWTGYIAASNVNSYHIIGGWHLGMKIEVRTLDELNDICRKFAIYNCNDHETGYRIRFWG